MPKSDEHDFKSSKKYYITIYDIWLSGLTAGVYVNSTGIQYHINQEISKMIQNNQNKISKKYLKEPEKNKKRTKKSTKF